MSKAASKAQNNQEPHTITIIIVVMKAACGTKQPIQSKLHSQNGEFASQVNWWVGTRTHTRAVPAQKINVATKVTA
jgi:hypothetical protein